MANLGEIVEARRTVEGDDSGHENGGDPIRKSSTKRKRSRRRNSCGSQGPTQHSPNSKIHEERQGGNGGDGWTHAQQHANGRMQGASLIQEDHQTRFYMNYRRVADEFDNEFLKKYNEDLNTTLIFAGLFSAVTSAFIIEVDSQLQPDPGNETTALLRVLIYEMNNAAFGGNVPTVPQWTGPPPTMVHVQAILFASLIVSLVSAFLAMLGKQWLNRYESADMRGSVVERGQNRQRKLDGIVAWYFNHVMESLPLMLQAALLLLGFALSRHLWEISITVALVVIGVTSYGVVFYIFITIAGAIYENCPYQTPGSQILRHLGPHVRSTIHSVGSTIGSVLRDIFKRSRIVGTIASSADVHSPWRSRRKIIPFLWDLIIKVPLGLAFDAYLLGRTTIQTLFTLPTGAYSAIRNANIKLQGLYSTSKQIFFQRTTPSGFRCISWTLQTSLNKLIHLTALEHLWTMTDLAGMDPILVTDCLNVYIGCVSFSGQKLVVMEGLERLATLSAGCFFRAVCRVRAADPTSSALVDLRRRYTKLFPSKTDFSDLPFYHTIMVIHTLAHGSQNCCHFKWDDYKPCGQDHIAFARHMVEVAQVEYRRREHRKVPRWILRFALHSLSLDPLPPASVIADCLTIVAIDLDCDISNVVALDESAPVEQISSLISQKLGDLTNPWSKRKAVVTLLPHAVRLEHDGQREMFDAILHVVRDDRFKWRRILTDPNTLFDEPPSLNRTISPASRYAPWDLDVFNTKKVFGKLPAAESTVRYSEEVDRDTSDTLLQISSGSSLRPHFPVDIGAWFKKRSSLPGPKCRERCGGSYHTVVRHIRGLRDIEFLKAYLLLIWSEWGYNDWTESLTEIEDSIREDFGGIEMWRHRDDLIENLDHIQTKLDLGLEYFKQNGPEIDENRIRSRKEQYGDMKKILLEVDKRAMESLTESNATFACALPLPCP